MRKEFAFIVDVTFLGVAGIAHATWETANEWLKSNRVRTKSSPTLFVGRPLHPSS